MRYLLDTHTLLWWLFDDPKLSQQARATIAQPEHEVLVSAASAWEISTKHRLGKLPEAGDIVDLSLVCWIFGHGNLCRVAMRRRAARSG